MSEIKTEIEKNIVFVYNTDSSLFADLAGAITKIVAPSKYQCNLCKITYGPLSMKDKWRDFLESLPFQSIFLHKSEFYSKYPNMKNLKLPAVFMEDVTGIKTIITSVEMNSINNLKDLENLVREAIK